MVRIPILRDEAAGKSPGEVRAEDIESFIAMPTQAAPHGPEAYTGIYIRGDAMKPTLCNRYIAVIDHTHRDGPMLGGRIVAVRLGDAVLVRRLASGDHLDKLTLRADNPEYGEITVSKTPVNPIIGDVVFWWGTQG